MCKQDIRDVFKYEKNHSNQKKYMYFNQLTNITIFPIHSQWKVCIQSTRSASQKNEDCDLRTGDQKKHTFPEILSAKYTNLCGCCKSITVFGHREGPSTFLGPNTHNSTCYITVYGELNNPCGTRVSPRSRVESKRGTTLKNITWPKFWTFFLLSRSQLHI